MCHEARGELAGLLLGYPSMKTPFARTTFLSLVIAGGLLPLSCATTKPPPQQAQLARAVAAPDRAEPPVPLSNTTRQLLRSRMASHANDMANLVSAIMILDYPRISERAGGIASDANMARPLTDDATELSSSIPPSFFDYQDELRGWARNLADAADQKNAVRVGNFYGKVSETCVKCHAVYRGVR
jgi:hypothetical protein